MFVLLWCAEHYQECMLDSFHCQMILFFYLKITTDCFIVAKLDLPFKNVISAVKCWVNPFVLQRS